MYKQLIIARKDMEMSPGKLAAQVSMAFLTNMIRNNNCQMSAATLNLHLKKQMRMVWGVL